MAYNKKYDITKYLEDNSVEFKSSFYNGNRSSYQDLNTWYEIEELLEESWKESGGNENLWQKMVGLDKHRNKIDSSSGKRSDRPFGCFQWEPKEAIKRLGGKALWRKN